MGPKSPGLQSRGLYTWAIMPTQPQGTRGFVLQPSGLTGKIPYPWSYIAGQEGHQTTKSVVERSLSHQSSRRSCSVGRMFWTLN